MKTPQSILVVVDPTAAEQPSIAKAASLAEKFAARIELFICDTKAARETRLLAERVLDPARLLTINLKPMLETLAQPLRERGLDVSTDCEFADSLVDGLLNRVRRTRADLVIKDTHHHSLLQRTLMTHTDWQLIRACPVPLLLTKADGWNSRPTLIAAVDPGHLNDKPAELDQMILEWSTTLARRLDGAVHAVHAYVPLTIAATAAGVISPIANTLTTESLEFEDNEKRRELQELTSRFALPADHLHLDLGVPADLLPRKAAELGADILVMGAIARSGLSKVFIGSTAERVLEKLPCDVLVVKPPDFESEGRRL